MKKIILFILISLSFSSSILEKGVGLSATSNENREGLLPGIGVNINFMPTFSRYNDNAIGLKLDIFISGMIYHEEALGLNDESWDLSINQFQTIDLIYRRNIKKGKIDISLFPLQSSESWTPGPASFITRIAYIVPLKNNFIEFFFRRIGSQQIGIIYQW